jgi:hypothetical protein
MDGTVSGWVDANVKSFYETYIFPNITAEQQVRSCGNARVRSSGLFSCADLDRCVLQVMLVPGSFGSNVNHYPNGTYVCNKVRLTRFFV